MSVSKLNALAIAAFAAATTFSATAADPATATRSSATSASAAAGGKAGSSSLSASDRKFVEHAAIGGMTEVELGKLAQQKAASDQVKQFGSRMVEDHGKANDELKQVASTKGVALPGSLDKSHQQDVDRLGKMSGANFDKAYMKHMVSDHKKDVSDFQKASKSAKDADVKAFASKTLPTLQEHLKLAQTTESAAKKEK